MKTIGLIGGMSWVATARYYTLINQEVARRLGKDHSAPIVIHSVDCHGFVRLLAEQRFDELGAALLNAARALENHGCAVVGLAANSMHVVADQIAGGLTVPFVNILEPASTRLAADGVKTLGLLGTGFTMRHPFYLKRLEARGFSVLVPAEDDVAEVSRIVAEELVHGIVREASRVTVIRAMEALARRGAEAVLLACTEIALLVEEDSGPLPIYDTTAMHVEGLLRAVTLE